jgi:nucleotide-binding universal stress UspA family protein
LVVLGQPDPDEAPPSVMSDFPEQVIMNCRTPVLIIPYASQRDSIGRSVLVAWNGSEEATQAVHNAIPLLQHATSVKVAMFDFPSRPDVRGDSSGEDLALYLARHDIQADVIQRKTVNDTGKELLSLATKLDSDMLVMGCYGHSRFREMLLGGTTRTVLESTTIPVLMSH